MKIANSWTMLVILLCSGNVMAETAFDPATLGHMKAVLDICGKVNRQEASQYLLQMKTMIGAATRHSVSKAEKTQAYRIAYDTIRSRLESSAPADFIKSCNAYLAESR